jgi:predicted  nucleic acid-binding Zn-ribbon protein
MKRNKQIDQLKAQLQKAKKDATSLHEELYERMLGSIEYFRKDITDVKIQMQE